MTAATYLNEKTLADRVNERLKKMKMSKAELGLHLNYSRSYVSRYLNGTYNSDTTEIEKLLIGFLEETKEYDDSESSGQILKLEKALPAKLQYFENTDYVSVIGLCSTCQENTALGIVVGKSGFGKTHALKKYATMPRTIYIECNETMNCKDIVRKIEAGCGLPRSQSSIDERLEQIMDFFSVNRGYLLIVDEADKLISKYAQKKIEMFRYIADGGDVGVVLAGELVLESLIKNFDKRFANRMDFYYKMGGLSRKEIVEYLEGYEIEESALNELTIRANNPHVGCFRLLDRTLNNVLRILRETGGKKITMKVISEASNMMML